MNTLKVKLKKYSEDAKMPERAHSNDFGYDVYATSEEQLDDGTWRYGIGVGLQLERENVSLGPILAKNENKEKNQYYSFGEKIVSVNDFLLALKESPINLDFDFRPRSSIWKHGMSLANCIGTIDENYTGEVFLVFYHLQKKKPRYKVGDKIAQFKLGITLPLEFEFVEELDETDRGTDSFGSSDK